MEHRVLDHGVAILHRLPHRPPVIALPLLEHTLLVHVVLLDVDEQRSRDAPAVALDQVAVDFERLDDRMQVRAVLPALLHVPGKVP